MFGWTLNLQSEVYYCSIGRIKKSLFSTVEMMINTIFKLFFLDFGTDFSQVRYFLFDFIRLVEFVRLIT